MKLAASLAIAVSLLAASPARAESPWEYAVRANAVVETSPPRITLRWPQDSIATPTSYAIARKARHATAWGAPTIIDGTATSWTDTAIKTGDAYEYQLVKNTTLGYTGYGYVFAGVDAPLHDDRGGLLLVVDRTFELPLKSELAGLEDDLVFDGYAVTRIAVGREDKPATVRAAIQSACAKDRSIQTLFLFGHVPVPYSGDLVPDGHPEHRGAWPADVYYGDLDGAWTDATVNITTAESPRHRNVPGDGKFDQTKPPSAIALQLGRVDLANMPGRTAWGGPATFPSEEALLRRYLAKDHAYRHKHLAPARRALVRDGFGGRGGEAFVASGFRNFAAFFGADKVTNQSSPGAFLATLAKDDYLFVYGGGAGSYTSIAGLGTEGTYQAGTTIELVRSDTRAPFALLMGSWLGDWDSEDNILRAVLATETMGLASAWSGRPHWFLHTMALGAPIGEGARLTQNNNSGLYKNQIDSAAGYVHVALMGDPTLRLTIVAPPSDVRVAGARVSWRASPEAVVGYHVYRSATRSGPFSRITTSLVNGTAWDDPASDPRTSFYLVRAIARAESGSGTWFEASEGALGRQSGEIASAPPTTPTPNDDEQDVAPMVGITCVQGKGERGPGIAAWIVALFAIRTSRRRASRIGRGPGA